jgi:hypothetical protein
MEEAQLLSPMGRIVGGIQIEDDMTALFPESETVTIDDDSGEGFSHPVEVLCSGGVFEAGEGWLGSQGLPVDRISIDEHLVNRVMAEPGGVVCIGVATGDSEDSLGEKFPHLVDNFSRLPSVNETVGKSFGDPKLLVNGFQQDGSAIGAGVGEVETGHQGSVEKLWKDETVCRILTAHRKASCVLESLGDNCFLTRGGFLVFRNHE